MKAVNDYENNHIKSANGVFNAKLSELKDVSSMWFNGFS